MSTLVSTILESNVWNYTIIPALLAQASLLHPYYEPNETFRILRFILAPIVIYLAFTSQSNRLFRPLEDFMHVNYAVAAIPTFHIVCSALQYAFQRGPVLQSEVVTRRKRNKLPRKTSGESESSSSATCSDSNEVIKSPIESKSAAYQRNETEKLVKKASSLTKSVTLKKKNNDPPSWGELTKFSFGLVLSPRCLEYTWAPSPSVLSRAPKKSVAWFVLEELARLIGNQLAMIAIAVFALPATQHPRGAHGYITEVYGVPDSAVLRYISQYALLSAYGAVGLHAFTIVGSVWNLVEVVWFTIASRVLPKDWAPKAFDTQLYPPLFNDPNWKASLTDFWGKGWHCVFRRDFMFCGAEPCAKLASPLGPIASRLAGLMGAMFMSGIMHEWGLISIVDRMDWTFQTTQFFLMIGVGIAIEAIIKHTTGIKIGGNLGRIWTFSWMGFWCRGLMRAWLERGLGASGIRAPCEYTDWSWQRYLVPLGPILPDRLLDGIKF